MERCALKFSLFVTLWLPQKPIVLASRFDESDGVRIYALVLTTYLPMTSESAAFYLFLKYQISRHEVGLVRNTALLRTLLEADGEMIKTVDGNDGCPI